MTTKLKKVMNCIKRVCKLVSNKENILIAIYFILGKIFRLKTFEFIIKLSATVACLLLLRFAILVTIYA